MNKISKALFIFCCLLLSACSSGWKPTVDPYNSDSAYRLGQDYEDCNQLADQASEGSGIIQQTAKSTFMGGLIGGISGGVLGAISGNAKRGAAYGAASGALGGGLRRGLSGPSSNNGFKKAYITCMRNRGHKVIN